MRAFLPTEKSKIKRLLKIYLKLFLYKIHNYYDYSCTSNSMKDQFLLKKGIPSLYQKSSS